MAWLILLMGSLCEVGWLIGMKYAEGFTRFWPSVIMVFHGRQYWLLGISC